MRANLYLLLQRILVREKSPRQPGRNRAGVVLMEVVSIRDEPAPHGVEPGDILINGMRPNNLAGHLIAEESDVLTNQAHRQHMPDSRNGRLDATGVLVGKAVFDDGAPA
jgi:hypothetical protein